MVKNMNMKEIDLGISEVVRRRGNKHYLVFDSEEIQIVKEALGFSSNKALSKAILKICQLVLEGKKVVLTDEGIYTLEE